MLIFVCYWHQCATSPVPLTLSWSVKHREIHKFTQGDGHMMVYECLPPDKQGWPFVFLIFLSAPNSQITLLYISCELACSNKLRVCVSVGFNSAQSFRQFSFPLFFSLLLTVTLGSWSKVTFPLQLQWTVNMTGCKHNNGRPFTDCCCSQIKGN